MKQGFQCADARRVRERLREWYEETPGVALLEQEQAQIAAILHNLFGYQLVQIGAVARVDMLAESRIRQSAVIDVDAACCHGASVPLLARADAVPLCADSVDVVLLHHTLEFEADPHQVLREVERILIPEGHVVIAAFNPWSFWGGWRLLRRRGCQPPWCGQFLGLNRIKDWLALLGFDVVLTRSLFFRPPLSQAGVLRRLSFLEKAGTRWWPVFAGVNIVVGKKRVATLTPVKPRWRPRRSLLPGLVKTAGTNAEGSGLKRHE